MITTWDSAERLAVTYMRKLGWVNATLTVAGADGGLDAVAGGVGAQVKFLSKPVGSPDVQRLRGATHGMEHALFFSNSGYTNSAHEVADATGVALFGYNVDELVYPVNGTARELAKRAGIDSEGLSQLQQLMTTAIELITIVYAQQKALITSTKKYATQVQAEAIALKQRGGLTVENVSALETKYAGVLSDVKVTEKCIHHYEAYTETVVEHVRDNDFRAIIETSERTLQEFDALLATLSFETDDFAELTETNAEEWTSRGAIPGIDNRIIVDLADAVKKMRARNADDVSRNHGQAEPVHEMG
jgi:hypothetical protein